MKGFIGICKNTKHNRAVKSLGIMVMALMFVAPVLMNCGMAMASWGGPLYDMEDYYRPGFNYEGLYALSQNKTRLTPGDDDRYMVYDYTKTINVWINLDQLGTDKHYCLKKTYTSYSQSGERLTRSDESEFVSCQGISADDWRGYYRSEIFIDQAAYTTSVDFAIYNATPNEWGGLNEGDQLLNTFNVKLGYADYDGDNLPRLELIDVSQGGQTVTPEEYNMATFMLNTYEDYEYQVKGYNLIPGVVYTVYNGRTEVEFTKADVENGLTIYSYAGNNNPFLGASNYNAVFGYRSTYPLYNDKVAQLWATSMTNGDQPTYDICVKYLSSDDCSQTSWTSANILPSAYGPIDIDDYDSTSDPIALYIKGINYQNDANYTATIKVSFLGQLINTDTFTVTGQELKNGLSKEYFNTLDYINYSQLFDGTFVEGGYTVEAKIGYTTRYLDFMANGGQSAQASMFSSDGMALDNYNDEYGGGMGSRGGNVFVEYTDSAISRDVVGDHMYLYVQPIESNVGEANYHIFYHPDDESELNDLRGATLIQEGLIDSNTQIGPVRLNQHDVSNDNVYYTVVLEKDGRILNIRHFRLHLTDTHSIGFMPVLRGNDAGSITGNTNYGVGYYDVHVKTPFNIAVYSSKMDSSTEYLLSVFTRMGSNNYYEEKAVSAADFDGDTVLFTIPYEDVIPSDSITVGNIDIRLKNTSGETILARTLVLNIALGTQGSNQTLDPETALLEIRDIKQNEQTDPDPGTDPDPDPGEDDGIINRAAGVAEVTVVEGTLNVQAEKACVVIGKRNNEFIKLTANSGGSSAMSKKTTNTTASYAYDISDFDEIYVSLKGDVNGDGGVTSRDSAMINYSLPSVSGDRHQDIVDDLMRLMADVNGDGVITSRDSAMINYSLPSVSGDRHQELEW